MHEDEDFARVAVDYIQAFFPPDLLSRKMLGEASHSYLYAPQAIRRIGRIFPEARFLVIVRNPLEMVPSYHARLLYILDEDVADFETAWRLQAQRANGRAIPSRCRDPRLLQYAEIGRVGARLADLVGYVWRARVKTIVFDDFKRAPVAVYRDVLDFLGLEDDARTELNRMNRSKAFRSRLLQRLLMKPPAIGQRLLVPEAGRPSHLSFAGQLRKRLRRTNVVRRHWSAISMSMHEELVRCFRDDVELLGRLLNRDLAHWLAAGPAAELSSNPEPDGLSASPGDVSVIGPTAL